MQNYEIKVFGNGGFYYCGKYGSFVVRAVAAPMF